MWFLASGGSAQERATPATPASNWASIIDLQAGPKAQWISVGAQLGLGNRWCIFFGLVLRHERSNVCPQLPACALLPRLLQAPCPTPA